MVIDEGIGTVWRPVYEKENSELKPVKMRLNH